LVKAESRTEKRAAGATTPTDEATLKGKIIEFAFWMQKQGYKESTINGRIMRLQTLMKRGADLLDPESFKKTLATQKTWSDGTKANGCRRLQPVPRKRRNKMETTKIHEA